MIELLGRMGVSVTIDEKMRIEVDASTIKEYFAAYQLVKTMRASILVLGPLLARFGHADVSLPGGCAIGARPVNIHVAGLQAMGADIHIENGYIKARADRLKGARLVLETVTVTGTENLMMAATLADGETVLENAAREAGGRGSGQFSERHGREDQRCGHGPDRHRRRGAVARHRLRSASRSHRERHVSGGRRHHRRPHPHQKHPPGTFGCGHRQAAGGRRQHRLRARTGSRSTCAGAGRPRSTSAPRLIRRFPTDMQAQFAALNTVANGVGTIIETIFENRFMHMLEMRRMGAEIRLEGNTAIIRGVERLTAAPVMATDLRASASLVLAALGGGWADRNRTHLPHRPGLRGNRGKAAAIGRERSAARPRKCYCDCGGRVGRSSTVSLTV